MTIDNRMSLAEYRRLVGLGDVTTPEPVSIGRKNTGKSPESHRKPAGNQFENCKAKRTRGLDGRMYATKAEADYANALFTRQAAGEIVGYVPQVSLPYGASEDGKTRRYFADFLVVHELFDDGRAVVGWVDVKRHVDSNDQKRNALRMCGVDVRTA